MKLTAYAAAGLALLTGFAPAATIASAQAQVHGREHRVVTTRTVVRDRHSRVRSRTVCNTVRRHGHNERVCHVVRSSR